ncbi:MAG: peptidoglycan DD-metalloendopeptidase family protein [Longimicrobiales bacterium]
MMRSRVRRRASRLLWAGLLALAGTAAAGAGTAEAQTGDIRREILDSQRRLEEIRAERARLQREMNDVRIRVRDLSSELANVERRLSASRSVLAEIQFQSEATSAQIEATTVELVQTRERLSEGRAVLNRRLRDIYKMGALHTARVLLGANSITDLLNRYRYLQQVAAFDRNLVDRVQELETELTLQGEDLQERMAQLGALRQNRLGEVAELRAVEVERQQTLEEYRSREERAATRLEQLEEDERRMTGLIDDLERRRIEEERRRAASADRTPAAGPTLSTVDAGSLDWPVEGEIIYRFGREQRPNGLVLRWNGVGIAAAPGTPVRAVRPGRVVLAGPFEGYGPTVVLSHGDGFYTLYLYLEEIGVVEGRDVASGQVVGTVGGRETPEGPHIEFQIRAPQAGGSPQAQDPLRWLRPRAGR